MWSSVAGPAESSAGMLLFMAHSMKARRQQEVGQTDSGR